jgi:hypothetical protein
MHEEKHAVRAVSEENGDPCQTSTLGLKIDWTLNIEIDVSTSSDWIQAGFFGDYLEAGFKQQIASCHEDGYHF